MRCLNKRIWLVLVVVAAMSAVGSAAAQTEPAYAGAGLWGRLGDGFPEGGGVAYDQVPSLYSPGLPASAAPYSSFAYSPYRYSAPGGQYAGAPYASPYAGASAAMMPAGQAPYPGADGGSSQLDVLLTAKGIHRIGGRLIWPLGIRLLGEAEGLRRQLEALLILAVSGGASPDELGRELTAAVDLLQKRLHAAHERGGLTRRTYQESEHFVRNLRDVASGLSTPAAGERYLRTR
jgi:hypothetical protein